MEELDLAVRDQRLEVWAAGASSMSSTSTVSEAAVEWRCPVQSPSILNFHPSPSAGSLHASGRTRSVPRSLMVTSPSPPDLRRTRTMTL